MSGFLSTALSRFSKIFHHLNFESLLNPAIDKMLQVRLNNRRTSNSANKITSHWKLTEHHVLRGQLIFGFAIFSPQLLELLLKHLAVLIFWLLQTNEPIIQVGYLVNCTQTSKWASSIMPADWPKLEFGYMLDIFPVKLRYVAFHSPIAMRMVPVCP